MLWGGMGGPVLQVAAPGDISSGMGALGWQQCHTGELRHGGRRGHVEDAERGACTAKEEQERSRGNDNDVVIST